MKISIPSNSKGGLEDQVGQHFGKVLNYTRYDTETGEVSIIPNTSEHNGGGFASRTYGTKWGRCNVVRGTWQKSPGTF